MKKDSYLSTLNKRVEINKDKLSFLDKERRNGRKPIEPLKKTHKLLKEKGLKKRQFNLVAQGDSWFDYPGNDLINYLRDHHEHSIENLAVAGSTLNNIVYGPVPKNWLGIPESDKVSRMEQLVFTIEKYRPEAVLLSGGGNDIAGPEFFQFINNSVSKLANPNDEVVKGVIHETFRKAYFDLVSVLETKGETLGIPLKVFIHGYDYPWPDGRGFTMFNIVGPWFDETFNKKNYPYEKGKSNQLRKRYEIVCVFIDKFNEMLQSLEKDFKGVVHHVDLRNTLSNRKAWANELHPTSKSFKILSDVFNLELHKHL